MRVCAVPMRAAGRVPGRAWALKDSRGLAVDDDEFGPGFAPPKDGNHGARTPWNVAGRSTKRADALTADGAPL